VKKLGRVALGVLVWGSVVGLLVLVWNNALIASPSLFFSAFIGLLTLSAVFSSAETAFTVLQEDVTKVLEDRASGRDPDAETKIHVRRGKKEKPSRFFDLRYNLIDNNIGEAEFQTLLSFLLVVANLTNLGGMSLITKSLTSGARSDAFSLVISSVIVVIVGEIFAKFVARRLPVRTASATVVLITPLKWLIGWYTSRLIVPFKWLLDRKWIVDRAP
jgi:CBS domain containing-hemolysin-like protein